jgi:hypothetical protein
MIQLYFAFIVLIEISFWNKLIVDITFFFWLY